MAQRNIYICIVFYDYVISCNRPHIILFRIKITGVMMRI